MGLPQLDNLVRIRQLKAEPGAQSTHARPRCYRPHVSRAERARGFIRRNTAARALPLMPGWTGAGTPRNDSFAR